MYLSIDIVRLLECLIERKKGEEEYSYNKYSLYE
jgi:hypothetical protein